MKKSIVLAFLLLFINAVFGQQTINATITHDGLQRSYILYVPASYSPSTAVPLLFNFHGYTSNASQQMFYGDFRSIADTAGFIIVHPQGTQDGGGQNHFNVGFGGSSVDDLGFSSALIDSISSDYTIDANRIYSTGMSNGGFMSFHLACNLSNRIAAVASVTGSMVPATMANCNASHMTPVLQIHGTNDGTVPYNGAAFSEGIQDVIDHWVAYNACSPTPIVTSLPNTSTTDGCTVQSFEYLNGDGCVTVKHLKVTNGGHTWPGSAINLSGTCYDINASLEIWRFLSRFDMNGVIGTCESLDINSLTEEVFTLYPNPSDGVVFIDGLGKDWQHVEVFDLSGQMILQTQLNQENNQINLGSLEQGCFIIRIANRNYRFFKV